jgi:hypothetical protein
MRVYWGVGLHVACRSKKPGEIRGLLLRQAEIPAAFIAMIEIHLR